jgi:uncharacterized protein (UPF0332 family)
VSRCPLDLRQRVGRFTKSVPQIPAPRLLRVATAKKQLLQDWREGVSLESATGHTLDALRQRATADRLQLAYDLRRRGNILMGLQPPLYRDAVSRFYYAMYHAMRAVVYFVEAGDDHQEHRELPLKTPPDFPQSAIWTNELKSARERRNSADYEAYPKSNASWRARAEELQRQANLLLPLARSYLARRGCAHL